MTLFNGIFKNVLSVAVPRRKCRSESEGREPPGLLGLSERCHAAQTRRKAREGGAAAGGDMPGGQRGRKEESGREHCVDGGWCWEEDLGKPLGQGPLSHPSGEVRGNRVYGSGVLWSTQHQRWRFGSRCHQEWGVVQERTSWPQPWLTKALGTRRRLRPSARKERMNGKVNARLVSSASACSQALSQKQALSGSPILGAP